LVSRWRTWKLTVEWSSSIFQASTAAPAGRAAARVTSTPIPRLDTILRMALVSFFIDCVAVD